MKRPYLKDNIVNAVVKRWKHDNPEITVSESTMLQFILQEWLKMKNIPNALQKTSEVGG